MIVLHCLRQGFDNIRRMAGYRKDTSSPLCFQRNVMLFKEIHDTEIIVCVYRTVQKSGVTGDLLKHIFRIAGICYITSAFASNIYLFAQFFIPLCQQHVAASLRSGDGCHHTGGAAAGYHDLFRHPNLLFLHNAFSVYRPYGRFHHFHIPGIHPRSVPVSPAYPPLRPVCAYKAPQSGR